MMLQKTLWRRRGGKVQTSSVSMKVNDQTNLSPEQQLVAAPAVDFSGRDCIPSSTFIHHRQGSKCEIDKKQNLLNLHKSHCA